MRGLVPLMACMACAARAHRASLSVHGIGRGGSAGPSCTTYSPGMHLVKLPELKRQFLFFVPRKQVESSSGVPLVMGFHGFSDNPWYFNQFGGYSQLLERYGWLGMFPFGLNANGTNGLGGIGTCCPASCDEECCRNGKEIIGLWRDSDLACRWAPGEPGHNDDQFVEALVKWASTNTCTNTKQIFATGFSNGAALSNHLGCAKPHLFRAVAPIAGDVDPTSPDYECKPAKPTSYLSMCGSGDYISHCDATVMETAKHWSKEMKCIDGGKDGMVVNISATSRCTIWRNCAEGNFVETCMTDGLPHNISGHLSPAGFSMLRTASDLDFPEYSFQKFSQFVGSSMLFYGHPTEAEKPSHEQLMSLEPPGLHDHEYLREGRAYGKDYVPAEGSASEPGVVLGLGLCLSALLLTCLLCISAKFLWGPSSEPGVNRNQQESSESASVAK